jgi:hypothetical protein
MSLDEQLSTVLHSGHVLENAGAHCMFSSSAAYLPTSEQKALKDFSNISLSVILSVINQYRKGTGRFVRLVVIISFLESISWQFTR